MSETPNRTEDIVRDEIRNQNNEFFNLLINTISPTSVNIENYNEEVDTIPCEICNNQIAIHNYTIHSQRCLERREIANRIRMNSINRRRELEIIQNDNYTFRPISFNSESNINYTPFQSSLNNEEESSNTNHTMNDEDVIDETNYNITDELPELIEDIDILDNNSYSSDDMPPLIDDISLIYDNNFTYSNIIDSIRNNINNSYPINLNLEIILNQLTENINNDEQITNLTNIITQLIRRPEPLNLEKVISIFDEDDFNNDENGCPLECPVCYENLFELKKKSEIQNKPVKILCGHKFCDKCIVKWFEKNDECPICKRDIRKLLKSIDNNNNNNKNENEDIENEIMDVN